MNYLPLHILNKLQAKIDLSNLCTCQLKQLAEAIEFVDYKSKELNLALIYLESLLQGIIYTYDRSNYWSYLEEIGDRKIAMVWHGTADIQFRMILKMPESVPSFEASLVYQATYELAKELLPDWLKAYENQFGQEASNRLKYGVVRDQDIQQLLNEFPFLRIPIETTF